jgi:hypothetical protein
MFLNFETSKSFAYTSLSMLVYFILLAVVNYFRWDFVLIGVLVELLYYRR